MAALEAELEELRAWKAQMVQQILKEQVETSLQLEAIRKGAQGAQGDIITEKGEEPAPLNSRLGLEDLRHSL